VLRFRLVLARVPATEANAAIQGKIAGYSADVQVLTNRRKKFVVVLAFESSGWADPTVQTLVNLWEQRASRSFGPDRRWLQLRLFLREGVECGGRRAGLVAPVGTVS
jgi:hypothetical protein